MHLQINVELAVPVKLLMERSQESPKRDPILRVATTPGVVYNRHNASVIRLDTPELAPSLRLDEFGPNPVIVRRVGKHDREAPEVVAVFKNAIRQVLPGECRRRWHSQVLQPG